MNITIIALILSFIPFHATCMDQPSYPQLQLELLSNKETKLIKGDLYINETQTSVTIGPKEYYNHFNSYNSPKASYGEPLIITLIKEQDSSDEYCLFLPARHLWNLDNGSTAHFTFPKFEDPTSEDFSTMCSLELKCIKNPNITESFQEQFSKCMNNFYVFPHFNPKNAHELADHNIITNLQYVTLVIPPNGFTATGLSCEHGSKGISSEEKFIQMMQTEKTAPYKDSAYRFVMQRQLGLKK